MFKNFLNTISNQLLEKKKERERKKITRPAATSFIIHSISQARPHHPNEQVFWEFDLIAILVKKSPNRFLELLNFL